MSLVYDREIFNKFRALAITEVSQLVVGKTYYGERGEFVLADILTQKQFHSMPGPFNCLLKEDDDDTKPKWILDSNGRTFSLNDSNIGASYNPWLIFDNKETAEACENELVITYDPSDDYYYYGTDYYEDDFYDYED